MLVIASITGIMMFIASVPMRPLLILFAGLVALSAIAIASTPYRRDRFETFINPERDCQNEGYHACQALIAVGSGGLVGLGVGNSVQAYGYLPETPTDSIFAIYSEKFGFIGSHYDHNNWGDSNADVYNSVANADLGSSANYDRYNYMAWVCSLWSISVLC